MAVSPKRFPMSTSVTKNATRLFSNTQRCAKTKTLDHRRGFHRSSGHFGRESHCNYSVVCNRSLTERTSASLCWGARHLFSECCLVLMHSETMSGRDLARLVDKARWLVGGCKAKILPPMLDSLEYSAFHRRLDANLAWVRTRQHRATDGSMRTDRPGHRTAPSSKKRRRHWQERRNEKHAIIRKLRDEMSESRSRGLLRN